MASFRILFLSFFIISFSASADCEKDGKTYANGYKLVDPDTPCRVCYCKGKSAKGTEKGLLTDAVCYKV